MNDKQKIRKWMTSHVSEHVDECNEVNCTAMVEAWDRDCSTGESTLDPDHIAWEIAVEVGEKYEKENQK